MYAVITTEEYKELLEEKQNAKQYRVEVLETLQKLIEVKKNFEELLLMIVRNRTEAEWTDHQYKWHDLADRDEVVEYINKNYVSKGFLQFKKVRENKNE